jgi:hypothetical protein
MVITLFEGDRTETYNTLAAAANAARSWYSDIEDEMPPWDYEIQSFEDLLEAIEEQKKRISLALENHYYPRPRLTAVGIEEP